MTTINELPIEVLIDSLLPVLPLRELLALGCTNKFFATVCADDTLWKRKTISEYNFSGAGSARTSGFKHLYRGLRSPRVFVWGDSGDKRLALEKRKYPATNTWGDINHPVELELGRRVVHLAAGGWSFHALTDDGRILVWGTLDSQSFNSERNNLAHSGAIVADPVALILPERVKALSVGRRLAVLLDSRNDAWVVRSWGRPARLVTPALDNSRQENSISQVEAGWNMCVFLTQTGEAFVVFPFDGLFDQQAQVIEAENVGLLAQDGEVRCKCWDIEHHPTQLPGLPTDLPTLHESATISGPPRLIKIAAGDKFVVGLTDAGHVLKLDLPTSNEAELRSIIVRGNLRWSYLPRFCDPAHVCNEPGFSQQAQGHPEEHTFEDLTVTHISAQFQTFVVYSTTGYSVVLLGGNQTTSESGPKIIPGLQNRKVISVVLGDYHFCAITADGELLSWGEYSNGALGLGDDSLGRVSTPTRVSFDHEDGVQDRYVFGVAAAGWHCGALVIDLHSSPSGSPRRERLEASSESRPEDHEGGGVIAEALRRGLHVAEPGRVQPQPIYTLPVVRGGGNIFRVGFAGRGAGRGRGLDQV